LRANLARASAPFVVGQRRGLSVNQPKAGLDKAPTGIVGLDQATSGGLPRKGTTLVMGGPGAGKTLLALECLVFGARQWNEPGIFVAFEENTSRIRANAASFGWEIDVLAKDRLFFLDADIRSEVTQSGNFDLSGMLAGLSMKVRTMNARRIVFDGIDVLLTLLQDPAAEQAEVLRIHRWLHDHGLIGIVTAKADSIAPAHGQWYTFAQYLADCAVMLERRHSGGVSERELTIVKYRGSSFTENKSPYVIGATGIEVAEQLNDTTTVVASTERVTSGVPRLDTMLNGGYFLAASVLITGLPGTAKSTLCGAFARAACQRGERTLYVTFDQRAGETARNLESVGLGVRPYLRSGMLTMTSVLSLTDSAEIHLLRIRAQVRELGVRCLVIDPISALARSDVDPTARDAIGRFIHWAKLSGITLVCSSLLAGPDARMEATLQGVSTLADTWIHLAYSVQSGERNRALTIVKSRGTSHSNQVRELILTKRGIRLADVYRAEGEVLMGTLRWERENQERDAEERTQTEARRARAELEMNKAGLNARLEALRFEAALNEAELTSADAEGVP
jgi:circadian clock protein KaiC